MAEVHIVGQIVSAENFPKQSLFCKWSIQHGNNWRLLVGQCEGQTQVDTPEFDGICKWFYPVDLHFATTGIKGWPKIHIQVYYIDWIGRSHIFGYGFIQIPTKPGNHRIECYTWRPIGNIKDRFTQHFLGGGPHLKYPDLVCTSSERFKLNTETMGSVTLELCVILRNFKKFAVECM